MCVCMYVCMYVCIYNVYMYMFIYVFDVKSSVIRILSAFIDRLFSIKTFYVTHSRFDLVTDQCVCLLD